METSRILLAVIIAFCLLVLASATLNARLVQATLGQAQTVEIDRVFAHFTDDTPGAALAIAKNGEIIYKQGYGMSNLEYDIPITPSFSISDWRHRPCRLRSRTGKADLMDM
jgi:CubicO group peptidase (beta-lactamase class C family)